jgi:hypothetical protein
MYQRYISILLKKNPALIVDLVVDEIVEPFTQIFVTIEVQLMPASLEIQYSYRHSDVISYLKKKGIQFQF